MEPENMDSPGEMKFCTRCGNGIEDEIVRRGYCPFCGTSDEGRRFCPDCGASLHQFGSLVTGEEEAAASAAVEETAVYDAAPAEPTGYAAEAAPAAETPEAGAQAAQNCPDCASQLYYVQQYNQWYCYTCKGYKQVS